ncbi:hypothetical protein BDF22DRAFT_161603 [Syncephalis plumigaleata]|nr:hypothetical protein BDF22DRAFT_161603 [Syncephalis plumigaleata]
MARQLLYSLWALVLYLVYCCPLVFGATGPSIRQDYVYAFSNSSSVDIDSSTPVKVLQDNVFMVKDVGGISSDGNHGILMDYGQACSATADNPELKNSIPRIPLIRYDLDNMNNCTIAQMVEVARNGSYIGAIILYTASATLTENLNVPKNKIEIPIFVISVKDGQYLLDTINTAKTSSPRVSGQNHEAKRYVRVTLYPGDGSFPVAMHCHLYRSRRNRRQQQAENGGNITSGGGRKTMLDRDTLDTFPIITYRSTHSHSPADADINASSSITAKETAKDAKANESNESAVQEASASVEMSEITTGKEVNDATEQERISTSNTSEVNDVIIDVPLSSARSTTSHHLPRQGHPSLGLSRHWLGVPWHLFGHLLHHRHPCLLALYVSMTLRMAIY